MEDGSLLGTATADAQSIMCYQLPGEITKTGEPIIGGANIDKWDYQFISLIYPKPKGAAKTSASRRTGGRKGRKTAHGRGRRK